MENLRGKTAIITGGTTGIGKAIADALTAEGTNVVAASRRTGCDVRKKSEVAKLVRETGRVDILVNNTGLGVQSKIVDCSEEDWHRVLDTNLTGTFLMTQAVLPGMRSEERR